jgi:hypothetical protein
MFEAAVSPLKKQLRLQRQFSMRCGVPDPPRAAVERTALVAATSYDEK